MSIKATRTFTIQATQETNTDQICSFLYDLTTEQRRAEIDRMVAFSVIHPNYPKPISAQLIPGSTVERISKGHYEVKGSTLGGMRETLQIFAVSGAVISGSHRAAAAIGKRSGSGSGSKD